MRALITAGSSAMSGAYATGGASSPSAIRLARRTFVMARTISLITDVTGHRSLEMLKAYSRDAEAFVGHAGAGLL
jgi:hypothetical protein